MQHVHLWGPVARSLISPVFPMWIWLSGDRGLAAPQAAIQCSRHYQPKLIVHYLPLSKRYPSLSFILSLTHNSSHHHQFYSLNMLQPLPPPSLPTPATLNQCWSWVLAVQMVIMIPFVSWCTSNRRLSMKSMKHHVHPCLIISLRWEVHLCLHTVTHSICTEHISSKSMFLMRELIIWMNK